MKKIIKYFLYFLLGSVAGWGAMELLSYLNVIN